jgi:hypothetical protein
MGRGHWAIRANCVPLRAVLLADSLQKQEDSRTMAPTDRGRLFRNREPPPLYELALRSVRPVANSAYRTKIEASEIVAAANAAHNPSDAATITSSASALRKRNVAWDAPGPDAASRRRSPRSSTGLVCSDAI